MGATLFKEVSYSLGKLIEDIDLGEIALPDIQRFFVWNAAKVRDLFDSMYKGFPVGYLLFWANVSGGGIRQIGDGSKQRVARLLIVDGQQRLTSLYAVLKGRPVLKEDYTHGRINIAFQPKEARFEVADAAIRRDPEFISNISDLWSGERSRNRFVRDFIGRLRASREVDEDEEDRLNEQIDQLYDLQNYPFTALELSPSVTEEEVSDVFVRINSKGVTLSQADFILTLMSVFWDEGRADLERFCRAARKPTQGEASAFNHFIEPEPDQLLRAAVALAFRRARLEHVYSLLRGKDLETRTYSEERRDQQFAQLEQAQAIVLDLTNWHEFLKTLVRAGFRGRKMVTSNTTLIYCYALYLIGKRDYSVDAFKLRNVIARWFFFSALTGRYTNSPESSMEEDLAGIRNVASAESFVEHLDSIIRGTFTDDYWHTTLPTDLVTSSARTPQLSAYHASLNLLDAKALFSELKVSELLDPALQANKAPLERHHLFPRNYLKQIGITEIRETNQIANFALIEWVDNINISDDPPATYIPKYLARQDSSSVSYDQMSYWHALPTDWENLEYSEFLEQRRALIASAIKDGFATLNPVT